MTARTLGPFPMSEVIDTYETTERARVESWRLHVLMEAGFSLHVAERLAASEVDLHQAVELLEAGCAPEIAAEILL